jgi:hypothetical protein
MAELALLQAGPSGMMSNALQFTIVTAVFLTFVTLVAFYIFRSLRKSNDAGVKGQLDAEFEKTKDALLLAAAAKKSRKEQEEGARRELAAEAKERDLLRENVDITRIVGQTDPLSGLEMMEDMELVVDPYTGQAYLLPSFINDWPPDQERPKFIYRHPQGTVVKTTDLLRSY